MTQTRHTPSNADQARDVVNAALAAGRRLEIIGGGGRRGYGRPVAADEVLDLSGLDRIISYQPEELVLTAGPGARLADIAVLLREQRQQLAFEPPDYAPLWGGAAQRGTLGGALMMGLGGPRRPFAGAPRDHLLGVKGVNGFGEAFAAGGRVVKNVTGYDLPKLLAGSLGTLAALTEVTVKVVPSPPETQTLLVSGLDDAQAIALMSAALGSPAAVSGAAHLPAAVSASAPFAEAGAPAVSATLLRLEGFAPSVVARMQGLRARAGQPDADIRTLDRQASIACWQWIADVGPFAKSERPLWRVSLPASKAAAFIAAVSGKLPLRHYYDWGGGLLWIELAEADAETEHAELRALLAASAGSDAHATLMRGPADLRARISPLQPLAPALAELTRRVKARFDPQGLFNPGRLYEDW